MLRIALTGGIGSGKSTVAELFARRGIAIIDADKIAYHLTDTNSAILHELRQQFGDAILFNTGKLDRAQLRRIVFQNYEHKQWLEQLLHPQILQIMQQQIAAVIAPYCIAMIPLLTETKHSIDFIDRVCVVDCPEELQIERASKRDQLTSEQIKRIMAHQSSRQQRQAIADDVIINDGSIAELDKQVEVLHQLYGALHQKASLD